ncbi:hypothetical protein TeGR_g5885 [Tetraparma gracilis]|uniref:60S acidic ribosomal protein P2 n=1 Tax=Tetraparma gracilis TaxID=2962635 RepID=A0ABQ6MCW6_9STRA|nr:hypothetical protein TeGR_g5885 [Tetraparma gracilis]
MATIPSTDEFLTSLAVLVTSDAGGEMTAETLGAVITAAGGKPNAAYTALFAGSIAKTGIEKMTAAPGSAGGGGGGGGGGAAEAAVEEEKPEEEEMDMGGSMDMFGGEEGGGGGGDY